MKKVLASLAVIAACTAATAAFAADNNESMVKGNIEVYGKAKVSVDLISTNSGSTGIVDKNLTRLSSNSSRLGIRGREDIGSDLSLVMQAEMAVGFDVGASTFKWRETFVGLQHEQAGTLLFGIHYTPYYIATGKLNIFSDTMGDYRAIMGTVNGTLSFGNRTDNTIMYLSPDWRGFKLMASTSESGQENKTSASPAPGQYSAAASYAGGPVYAAVAHEEQKNGFGKFSTAGTKVAATRAGLGLTFDGTKIGVIYELLKDDRSDSVFTRNAYYATISQKFGEEVLKLAYGKAEDGKSIAETGASVMTAGLDHKLSKRSTVYVLYSKTTNDDGATYGLGTDGPGGAYTPRAGEKPSVVSIGVAHNF